LNCLPTADALTTTRRLLQLGMGQTGWRSTHALRNVDARSAIMMVPGQAHTVLPSEGRVVQLGIVQMRVLVGSDDVPAKGFTLTDFSGGEGAWTVPHLHRNMEESCYVLDGTFTFTAREDWHLVFLFCISLRFEFAYSAVADVSDTLTGLLILDTGGRHVGTFCTHRRAGHRGHNAR
jgi:hypothetical protein